MILNAALPVVVSGSPGVDVYNIHVLPFVCLAIVRAEITAGEAPALTASMNGMNSHSSTNAPNSV